MAYGPNLCTDAGVVQTCSAGSASAMSNGLLTLASGYIQSFTWVKIDFGVGVQHTITKLRLHQYNLSAYGEWKGTGRVFQGSNDDSNWYLVADMNILTAPGAYPGWSPDMTFANSTPYRYYRISGLAGNGNCLGTEWEMMETIGVAPAYIGFKQRINKNKRR